MSASSSSSSSSFIPCVVCPRGKCFISCCLRELLPDDDKNGAKSREIAEKLFRTFTREQIERTLDDESVLESEREMVLQSFLEESRARAKHYLGLWGEITDLRGEANQLGLQISEMKNSLTSAKVQVKEAVANLNDLCTKFSKVQLVAVSAVRAYRELQQQSEMLQTLNPQEHDNIVAPVLQKFARAKEAFLKVGEGSIKPITCDKDGHVRRPEYERLQSLLWQPIKPKREQVAPVVEQQEAAPVDVVEHPPKRKRGRPRKDQSSTPHTKN